jgi:hypothetical protein
MQEKPVILEKKPPKRTDNFRNVACRIHKDTRILLDELLKNDGMTRNGLLKSAVFAYLKDKNARITEKV